MRFVYRQTRLRINFRQMARNQKKATNRIATV